MYKKDVFKYMKTNKKISESLGISHAAVCAWGKIIPELRAVLLDRLTNGKLKYNPKLYRSSKR